MAIEKINKALAIETFTTGMQINEVIVSARLDTTVVWYKVLSLEGPYMCFQSRKLLNYIQNQQQQNNNWSHAQMKTVN